MAIAIAINSIAAKIAIATIELITNLKVNAPTITPATKEKLRERTPITTLIQLIRQHDFSLKSLSLNILSHPLIFRPESIILYVKADMLLLHKFIHCTVAHIYVEFSGSLKGCVH